MFRKDLERRLSEIFGFDKTTFDAFKPDTPEQDTLFISILHARSKVGDKSRETARVSGDLVTFSQIGKLPYGFFAKKIERASVDAKRGLNFYEIDVDIQNSPARFRNIHERRCSFVFLYDAQHDPARGTLNSLTWSQSDG